LIRCHLEHSQQTRLLQQYELAFALNNPSTKNILYKAELKYGLLLNKIFFINMKVIVIRILIIHNTFFNRYFLPFGQINFRKKYISFKFMMNLCYIHLLNVRQEQFINLFTSKNKNFFFISTNIKYAFDLVNYFSSFIFKIPFHFHNNISSV